MTNDELLAAISERFDQNDARWDQNDARWDQNEARWDENWRQLTDYRRQLEENRLLLQRNRRHSDVRFEAVEHQIERLVEAIALVDAKLERFREETNRRFDELRPSS